MIKIKHTCILIVILLVVLLVYPQLNDVGLTFNEKISLFYGASDNYIASAVKDGNDGNIDKLVKFFAFERWRDEYGKNIYFVLLVVTIGYGSIHYLINKKSHKKSL